jgi:hypothetical protein
MRGSFVRDSEADKVLPASTGRNRTLLDVFAKGHEKEILQDLAMADVLRNGNSNHRQIEP